MMDKPVVASFGSFRNQDLEDSFQVIGYDEVTPDSPILDKVEGIVLAKIVGTDPIFIKDILPKMTNLKIAMPQGIGYDYMEHLFDYFRDHGVTVGSNSGEVASSTIADFTMTLLIAAARMIFQAAARLKEASPGGDIHSFHRWTRSIIPHTQHVTGATMGIIGMGSIGLAIAKRAHHGFDMKVLYNNRSQRSQEDEDSVNASYYKSLHEMLPLCDFVVIACDLNPQSRKLMGGEELSCMKKSSVLVNIARGAVVDTEALTQALQSGGIGAAGLEVTVPEPLPQDHPLRNMENVVITPHMASSLRALRQERNMSIVGQLKTVIIENKPLEKPVV